MVVERAPGEVGRTKWRCRCDCGIERDIYATHLKSGHSNSCGCGLVGRRYRRWGGRSASRLFKLWEKMHARCAGDNPWYGGRGIKVCEEWSDFDTYETWAKANGYDDSLSIDRIDNDKGYSPDNCRWATKAQQDRNRRNNRWVTYNGERMVVVDAAAKSGIKEDTILSRLDKGWPESELFRTPTANGRYPRSAPPAG